MSNITSKLKIYEVEKISDFNYLKKGVGTFSEYVYVKDINSSDLPYPAYYCFVNKRWYGLYNAIITQPTHFFRNPFEIVFL